MWVFVDIIRLPSSNCQVTPWWWHTRSQKPRLQRRRGTVWTREMYFHQTGCYSLFVQEPVKRASPFSLFFFILWMQGTLLSWQVLRPTKETAKWENFGVYLVSIQWLICWRVSSKERERERKKPVYDGEIFTKVFSSQSSDWLTSRFWSAAKLERMYSCRSAVRAENVGTGKDSLLSLSLYTLSPPYTQKPLVINLPFSVSFFLLISQSRHIRINSRQKAQSSFPEVGLTTTFFIDLFIWTCLFSLPHSLLGISTIAIKEKYYSRVNNSTIFHSHTLLYLSLLPSTLSISLSQIGRASCRERV